MASLLGCALGQVHEAHAAAVDRHTQSCERCQLRQQSLCDDIADLALALEPCALPAMVRESILHSTTEIHRLYDASEVLAQKLGVEAEAVQLLLSRLDLPRFWEKQQERWVLPVAAPHLPGARIVRLQAGDALHVAVGLARTVPMVPHLLLLLQGGAHDDEGRVWRAEHQPQISGIARLRVQPGADFLGLLADVPQVQRPAAPDRKKRLSWQRQKVARTGDQADANHNSA